MNHEKTGYLDQLGELHPLSRLLQRHDKDTVELLVEDGVLIPSGGAGSGKYLFLHLTFQEYLTASALAQDPWDTVSPLVDRKAWLPEWSEAIILLAGTLIDAAPLLNLLGREEVDDYLRHRLCLAAECVPELRRAMPDRQIVIERIVAGTQELWWSYEGRDVGFRHLDRAFRSVADAAILDEMVGWLASGVDARWQGAIRAFAAIGGAAATQSILARLAELLRDENARVRSAAVVAVERIGAAAATPIPRTTSAATQ